MAQTYTKQGPFADRALPALTGARATAMDTGIYLASAPVVTTLPATPVDGQECNYLADATNGVMWHLVYQASSSKWVFTGGPPLVSRQARSNITRSAAYVTTPDDGGGVLPAVTVPLLGDYDLEFSATEFYDSNANTVGYYTPKMGAAAAVDADGLVAPPATFSASPGAAVLRKTAVAAATVIQMQVREQPGAQAGALRISNPWLRVTPVRFG